MASRLFRRFAHFFELLANAFRNPAEPFSTQAIGFACNASQLFLYSLLLRHLALVVGDDSRRFGVFALLFCTLAGGFLFMFRFVAHSI